MRSLILDLIFAVTAFAAPTTFTYSSADFNAGPVLFTAIVPSGSFDLEYMGASADLRGIWQASLTGSFNSGLGAELQDD